jgi:hypothetical protein
LTTNRDRIIEALRRWPGLDDDALEQQADVHPRQQVNQICRHLEQQGVLQRAVGSNGKIGNFLVGSRPATSVAEATVRPERPASLAPPRLVSASHADHSHAVDLVSDPLSTLFIICCSKGKKGRSEMRGPSLLTALSPPLADRLKDARDAMRVRAHVDVTMLVPAWRRYSGTLYEAAAQALADVEDRGLKMLIISGGYGLVLPGELIGNYNAKFRRSSWPPGLLEDVLIDYAHRHNLTSMRAITSATGDYRKLVKCVRWATAGVDDAMLLCPRAGPGAIVLSPRAQGEVLTALLRGTMDAGWSSSDGLCLDVHRLA